MGGSAKKVVAVVAAVAIPFAAPAIATSIGLSATIGAAAANTVVGATLGAVTAKATGGDPLIGAVTGGAGGYFGGGGGDLFAGPTTAATGGASVVPAAPGSFQAALPELGVSTAAGAPGSVGATILPAAPGSFQAALPGLGVNTVGASVLDFGSQLSGAPATAPGTSTTAPGGDPYVFGSEAADFSQVATTAPAAAPTTATTAATAPAAGTPTTFSEAISRVPGAIAEKFKDPKALADMTLRAAGQLAGAALAGDGLSPEEQQLLAAERADLERLRNENEALFRERLSAAQNLIGDSRYFDPEYFGLQRARQSQIAGARAKRAGLRGLRGRQRDVAERQFDIETARTTGSAYDVGAQAATTGRLQTQQAGLSLMPTSFPSVSYSGLRGAYESADKRRRQTAGDVADLFGSLTGRSQAGSIG